MMVIIFIGLIECDAAVFMAEPSTLTQSLRNYTLKSGLMTNQKCYEDSCNSFRLDL